MPGPYGITEVDVPGILNAYEAGRANRIRQMVAQTQLQAAERTADREQRFREAALRLNGQGGGEKGGGAQPSPIASAAGIGVAANPYPTAVPAQGAPAIAGLAPPAAAPAMSPQAQPPVDRNAIFRDLIAIDPEQAQHVMTAFRGMDDAQHAASERANTAIAREAQFMLGLPEAEWPGEFQRAAQSLRDAGVPVEAIQNFQLSRQGLERAVAQARDIEKLREEARPRLRNVEAGASVIDENRIGRTGDPVVYESPLVRDSQGQVYRRDTGPPEIVNPQTGERRRLNPQTNQWEPVPAGGAGSGQRGFP